MATSGKGRTNGTAFVLGCYAFAAAFVGLCVLLGCSAGTEDAGSDAHVTVDIVEIVLGVVLLVLAVLQWRNRNHTGTPKWMSALDGLSIWQAFLAGVLISGPLSPKDLPLLIAASGRVSQSRLPVEEIMIVILIFAFIGVLGVLIPWLISVISPSKVEARLSGVRDWLVANHAVTMMILFVILGAKLISSGVADLAY